MLSNQGRAQGKLCEYGTGLEGLFGTAWGHTPALERLYLSHMGANRTGSLWACVLCPALSDTDDPLESWTITEQKGLPRLSSPTACILTEPQAWVRLAQAPQLSRLRVCPLSPFAEVPR